MAKKISKKPFYHQWIRIEKVYMEVKKVGLSEGEEKEIWDLLEETIHTRVLDAVLEKLPEVKHEEFLEKFRQKPDDTALLNYLRAEIDDIENHLDKTFQELETEILKDITTSLTTEK